MRKVIIDDVAAKAGVSIKTVSRVMNREPNVRAATREKVLAVAKDLGYRPNLSARGLAGKNSYLIALLYHNPSATYLTNLQKGVLEQCQASGYGMVLQPFDSTSETVVSDIQNFVRQSRVDGVVLSPPLSDHMALVSALKEDGTPHVIVSPPDEILDEGAGLSVQVDNRAAARQMTDYLISIGHSRIAFVKGNPTHGAGMQRFDGYKDGLSAAGVAYEEALVAQGYFDFESGIKAAEKFLALKERPTAIFAGNDEMAAGVMQVLLTENVSIPDDMSVVGFDDTPLSRQIWPKLTTVRQPIRDMGAKSAEILMKHIKDPESVAAVDFPFELKIRNSSSAL